METTELGKMGKRERLGGPGTQWERRLLGWWTLDLEELGLGGGEGFCRPGGEMEEGPVWETRVGGLTSSWQLVLHKGPRRPTILLRHRSEDFGNQGVRYRLFAKKQNGAVQKIRTGLLGSLGSRGWGVSAIRRRMAQSLLSRDGKIRLGCLLFFPLERWNAEAVAKAEMLRAGKEAAEGAEGLGSLLWSELSSEEQPPLTADLRFVCGPEKESVWAHSAVVAAFSPHFRDALQSEGRRGLRSFRLEQISAPALRHILHFLYRRRTADDVADVPLDELLQASQLFQCPQLFRLSIQPLLINILTAHNRRRLSTLAADHSLPILANATSTLVKHSDSSSPSIIH